MNSQVSSGRKTTTPSGVAKTIDKTNKSKCTAASTTTADTATNMAKSNKNNSGSNETQLIIEDSSAASAPVVNFMSKFRDKETRVLNNLNSQQFIEVWNNYDKDGKYVTRIGGGGARELAVVEVAREARELSNANSGATRAQGARLSISADSPTEPL